MRYIGTRDNHRPVSPSEAVLLGMVPGGGLFVPETIPALSSTVLTDTLYLDTARSVINPYFNDLAPGALEACLYQAYNPKSFDTLEVAPLRPLEGRLHLLDLWHGPTAAFKDIALQFMPHLTAAAKERTRDRTRTLILVATSGDTGKAALEGFKNAPGISIAVFYPDGGVSEVQRLQMAVTGGNNTAVFAVRGNFDDCQTAVKGLFGDPSLVEALAGRNIALSSANSINWGRLAPQIVYYVRAYAVLAARGFVRPGGPVDLCVPTGNFGNILAGWYARAMGLPVRRLICASNRNHILSDFFGTGVYDMHREFHRTSSPSMDILISSNLERFLFEITGRDATRVRRWFGDLARSGRFEIDPETRRSLDGLIVPGWADEPRVFAAIKSVFERTGILLDPHTAVGAAVAAGLGEPDGPPVILASTASPFKFAGDVLEALTGEREADEFAAIEKVSRIAGQPVHRAVRGLKDRPVLHSRVLDIDGMRGAVEAFAAAKDPS